MLLLIVIVPFLLFPFISPGLYLILVLIVCSFVLGLKLSYLDKRGRCVVGTHSTHSLGVPVIWHGLICYVTTDRLMGKGLLFSCSSSLLVRSESKQGEVAWGWYSSSLGRTGGWKQRWCLLCSVSANLSFHCLLLYFCGFSHHTSPMIAVKNIWKDIHETI